MTYRNTSSFPWRAAFACAVLLTSLCAAGEAQTTSPNPDMRIISDWSFGTPCDSEKGLPCDRTPTHLVGLPDPSGWSVVGRGANKAYYRRATQRELRANGWAPGAYLVAGNGPVNAARGLDQATLYVPVADSNVIPIVFKLDERVEDMEFFERIGVPGSPDGAVVSRRINPVMFEYFNQGFDPKRRGPVNKGWARMVSGSEGGLFASGLADGFEFEMDGPNGGWNIDKLPAPGGFAPNRDDIVKVQVLSLGTFGGTQYQACSGAFASPACDWFCTEISGVPCTNNPHIGPAATHHCADGGDNDVDGTTDVSDKECAAQAGWGDDVHPGFPKRHWESGKSFGLFGDGRFCTAYATAEYSASGSIVTSGSWYHRLTAMGWQAEALLNESIGFQGVTGREKQFRYRVGGCWVFPSVPAATACAADGTQCLSGYPYANSGQGGAGYYSKVWDDVHHATYVGLNDALHYAQAVYWHGSGSDTSMLTCDSDGEPCCGQSIIGASGGLAGASVADYSCGNAGVSSAHEMGHSSGLDHVYGILSFMNELGHDSSALPAAEHNALVSCVSSWNCPRPSGFRYTGAP
ncbi:MAG: hypothetical protein GC160_27175 [Acidobacteria bacterium]|nr:hypothetical protein [Acidobacteriota bacterium]